MAHPLNVEALIAARWNVELTRRGGEWHGPCPWCGGTDRFVVFASGVYWCRPGEGHCGRKGWLGNRREASAEQVAGWRQEIAREEARRAQEVQQRLERLRREAARDAAMLSQDGERQRIARDYFTHEGLSVASIERYGLGYTRAHTIEVEGQYATVPAYTIPLRDPVTDALVNMQYRLVNPPLGIGKYRQAYHLSPASFFAERTLTGDAVVVEGAKKAIVVAQFLEGEAQVVGLPGKNVGPALLAQLEPFERLFLLLDPGSDREADEIAERLAPRVRVAHLPGKPDDLIVRHGMTAAQFRGFLDSAEWIR